MIQPIVWLQRSLSLLSHLGNEVLEKKGFAVSARGRPTSYPTLRDATPGPVSFLGLPGLETLRQPEVCKV